jgi:hypothetical protein
MNPFRIYGRTLSTLFVCLCILMAGGVLATAHAEEDAANSFTYQGQLYGAGGVPVTEQCDFTFALYNAVATGSQVGSTVTLTAVQVSKGIFSVDLTFGANVFSGGDRWLEIGVKCPPAAAFSTLSPRQPINPTPYAHYAYRAPWSGLTGIPTDIANGDNDTLAALSCSANQVALWNGTAWACAAPVAGPQGPAGAHAPRPAQVIWVAKSGGDFASVGAALASVTDASPTKRYLIKIAPGIYEEKIDLKSYVDLEGSGEGVTIIRGAGGGSNPVNGGGSATLRAQNTIVAEVRFLSVESSDTGGGFAVAIWNKDVPAGNLRFTHVRLSAAAGTHENHGLYNSSSSPALNNVTISCTGGTQCYGVYNSFSSLVMDNLTISVSGAFQNYGILNSQSSPVMNNIKTSASGGSTSYGVYNSSGSSPIMNNVTALASSANNSNFGIFNSGSSPLMSNITSSASGGTGSYAVYNSSNSSPVMNNVTASAFSAVSYNIGVVNNSSSPVIRSSAINGSSNSILNEASTTKVAHTMLTGSVLGSGFTCIGVYRSNFTTLNATCQ